MQQRNKWIWYPDDIQNSQELISLEEKGMMEEAISYMDWLSGEKRQKM